MDRDSRVLTDEDRLARQAAALLIHKLVDDMERSVELSLKRGLTVAADHALSVCDLLKQAAKEMVEER